MQWLNADTSVILKPFNSWVAKTNSSKVDMFEYLRFFGPKLYVALCKRYLMYVRIGVLTFLSAPG